MEKEQTAIDASLYFLSEENKAIAIVQMIIGEMLLDFKEFEKKNPGHEKIQKQSKRFDSLINCLNVIAGGYIDRMTFESQIARLRWTLSQQLSIIQFIEKTNSDLKEQIAKLEEQKDF